MKHLPFTALQEKFKSSLKNDSGSAILKHLNRIMKQIRKQCSNLIKMQ